MAGAFSPKVNNEPPVSFPIASDGSIDSQIVSIWNENNPINMIKDLDGKNNLSFFIYCGGKDEYKLLPENEQFVDSLTKYGHACTKKFDADADHVNSLVTSFPLGINFLYNVMDTSKIDSGVGIREIAKAANGYIYPNPAFNQLQYHTDSWSEVEGGILISAQGSIIELISKDRLKNGIDINKLNSGYYLLKINYNNGNVVVKKFTKMN